MHILLLGSGGREHALAYSFTQSPLCTKLFIAPGNAGTGQLGKNLDIDTTNFEALAKSCKDYQIDMIFVGNEEPLVKGIVDYFAKHKELKNIAVIGPCAYAAQLEGSKVFSKMFMQKHKIPTAAFEPFTYLEIEEAKAYVLQQNKFPVVIKASGLAAGKGVIIAQNLNEAYNEIDAIFADKKFGSAGNEIVIEEFLDGIECSVFVITDGESYYIMPEAKDYKRIGEKDTGLNTGGMGAISPVPFVTEEFLDKIKTQIIEPTLLGLATVGYPYTGVLFLGIIKVQNQPFVIEYNCRLGDPETEVVLPRIENDWVRVCLALALKQLHTIEWRISPQSAATVMLVSQGYPQDYQKGFNITQIPEATETQKVFHAGTILNNQHIQSNGGRVLSITNLAPTLTQALQASYQTASQIEFSNKNYRKDIGWEFL